MTSISPTIGTTSGGTSVTITGTNFTDATAVNFGGTAASSFAIDSDTAIAVISPANSAGVVDVTIATVDGTSAASSADQFTYSAEPTVASISPNAGPTSGGTSVTITGTNFTGATAIQFGSTVASSFTVNSDTQITAVSPAGSVDTVDVTVTTAGGTSASSSAAVFDYQTATTTLLTTSSNAATFGQSVTFTATVAPVGGSALPTGAVTFMDGSSMLGIGQLRNVNGAAQATLTTSALAVGSPSVTASYAGSVNFSGSTSTAASQSIVPAPSSLSGVVFNDVNDDEVFNTGDVLLTGVILTLASSDSSFSPLQVKTGIDGTYRLLNLPAGTYSITKTQPQGLTNGAATVGVVDSSTNGTSPNDNSIANIQLSSGASGTGYNFSELGLAANAISIQTFLASTPTNKRVLDEQIAASYAQASIPTNVPVGIASAPL